MNCGGFQGAHRRRKRRLARDLLLLFATRPDRLLNAAWWWLIGKRLRSRYRLADALAALPFAHARWMADAGSDDLAYIRSVQAGRSLPGIAVHLHVARDTNAQQLREAAASIAQQSLLPQCIVVTSERDSTVVPKVAGCPVHMLDTPATSQIDGLISAGPILRKRQLEFVIPLASCAKLPRHAIAAYVAHLLQRDKVRPAPMVIYGDQHDPEGDEIWLKPEWDARMAWSQDYFSASCAVSVAAASDMQAGVPSLYAAILYLLRFGDDPGVEHVARVTVEVPNGHWCASAEESLAAVRTIAETGTKVAQGPFATVQLQYPLPSPVPKVSVVVATRDRVELLRTCVQGVLEQTAYPDLELIIADNDSRDPETLLFMQESERDPRVRVVRWPHPFNYSAINNFAAGFATGEYLCLLNNDIEVIEPAWLDALVREAVQPGVGAVGARLLYPDLSIQHAGVVIGMGNAAGHAHRGLPDGEPGYFAQALIARGATAVTGACLLVSKRHFRAVGGLDEDGLAVAYNDIDLCLKLRELDLSNIYTPAATLIHHESKSRGLDFAPENLSRYTRELAVFQKRWATRHAIDRWHHPRLDRDDETLGLH